jgi:exopolysaccharide biosynthesis polyprenyl glycosylphosphotransferase
MLSFSRKTQSVYIVVDVFLMVVSFSVPYILRYNTLSEAFSTAKLPNLAEYCFVFALWGVFIVIQLKSKQLYSTDRGMNIPKELLQVVTCILYPSVIVGSIVFLAKYKFFSRLVFCASFLLLCILLGGWRTIKRLILRKLIREGFHNINLLIIGANKVGKIVLEEIKNQPYRGFKITGFLDDRKENFVDGVPVLGKFANFTAIARKYFVDEVIVAIPSKEHVVSKLVEQAQKMRLGVRMVPEHLENSLPILDVAYLGIIPLLTYTERKPHPSEAAFKRFFDLAASTVLIVLLMPLFIITAILIKTDSSGPVFFIQKRIGLKGRIFILYKFRSMIKDADKLKYQLLESNEVKDGVIFKIKDDPRITKIGKFLRRYSLDELPQLFNVLKGDMSLVGPRPPLPSEINEYDSHHMNRLSIKPGMTGLSQIRGRSNLSFSRWVKWDLWYINNWSFRLDMRILLWTIPTVLKGKGAC